MKSNIHHIVSHVAPTHLLIEGEVGGSSCVPPSLPDQGVVPAVLLPVGHIRSDPHLISSPAGPPVSFLSDLGRLPPAAGSDAAVTAGAPTTANRGSGRRRAHRPAGDEPANKHRSRQTCPYSRRPIPCGLALLASITRTWRRPRQGVNTHREDAGGAKTQLY